MVVAFTLYSMEHKIKTYAIIIQVHVWVLFINKLANKYDVVCVRCWDYRIVKCKGSVNAVRLHYEFDLGYLPKSWFLTSIVSDRRSC